LRSWLGSRTPSRFLALRSVVEAMLLLAQSIPPLAPASGPLWIVTAAEDLLASAHEIANAQLRGCLGIEPRRIEPVTGASRHTVCLPERSEVGRGHKTDTSDRPCAATAGTEPLDESVPFAGEVGVSCDRPCPLFPRLSVPYKQEVTGSNPVPPIVSAPMRPYWRSMRRYWRKC